MGDMGVVFREMRAANAARRANNLVSNTAAVEESELSLVERYNFGLHLRVRLANVHADFWPSTGKWHILHTKYKGSGLASLVQRMRHISRNESGQG